MQRLPPSGAAILRELVDHIDKGNVDSTNPQTFLGYKEVHDALGLPMRSETFGNSLKVQGLADLAEWTKVEGHPAITGLIVDKSPNSEHYLTPGDGYFRLFGKRYPDDYAWWTQQIRRSLAYDWYSFLNEESAPPADPTEVHPTEKATDLGAPPERVRTTTYRILRDTELARRVKALHHYRCQLCGHTIELHSGALYAEAHHIQPLGKPHNGPDIIGNILCLCPNHHAEMDYGVRRIEISALRLIDGHAIDSTFVDYHNGRIYGQATTAFEG